MALQTDSDPSSLLTTALEKLLYLESRLDSAEAARDEARRDGERHRLSAQAARQALADWQRRATDAEVTAEGAEREVSVLRGALAEARQQLNAAPREAELSVALQAAQERLARFALERETWLDRMITLQQLGSGGDELDLGAFIAELRAELLALRRGDTDRVGATVGDRPAAPDADALLAAAPSGQVDAEELHRNARLPRSERTLASLCARDLQSDSAAVRRRSAERLLESGVDVLGSFIATLLGREPEPGVRVVYVKLLARVTEDWSTLALQRALRDPDARVRAAALEALSRRPGVDVSAVRRDPAPAVRRRALTLLPKSESASVEVLSQALSDDDASVRHVAALALASHPGPEVTAVLTAAAQSADVEVREVARKALERRGLLQPAPQVAAEPISPELPVPAEEPIVAMPATPSLDLDEAIAGELSASLRGCTVEELVGLLQRDAAAVSAAVERLVAAGRVVRRGKKLFQP